MHDIQKLLFKERTISFVQLEFKHGFLPPETDAIRPQQCSEIKALPHRSTLDKPAMIQLTQPRSSGLKLRLEFNLLQNEKLSNVRAQKEYE